jgi:hypothetical protein
LTADQGIQAVADREVAAHRGRGDEHPATREDQPSLPRTAFDDGQLHRVFRHPALNEPTRPP